MPPQHGTCEHPKLILEREYLQYEGDPTSRSYERKCILRAKSFALRRGGELRLIFGNGTTKAYKDSSSKACEQGPYESCKQYLLYEFFPEHKIFLIHVGYRESQQWLLMRQRDGGQEEVVAPPGYSPNRKWLASVNWTDGPDDGNNGIDIVPADLNPVEPAFHYRPENYELWEFVRWDGDDRLLLKVTAREGNDPKRNLVTLPAEVVRLNGKWQLNNWKPVGVEQTASPPTDLARAPPLPIFPPLITSRPDTPTSTPMDWKKVKTIVVRPDQPAPIVPPMAAVQGHIATADGTGYFVQVASQRSEADAQIAFRSLQAKFPGLLAQYASLIKRADLVDKGVRYNVLVGPFSVPEKANEMCSSLKAAGGQCIVQRE